MPRLSTAARKATMETNERTARYIAHDYGCDALVLLSVNDLRNKYGVSEKFILAALRKYTVADGHAIFICNGNARR